MEGEGCSSSLSASRFVVVSVSYTHLDVYKRQVKELGQFLHEFKDCFAVRGQSLGRTSLVQHRINTGDTTPIRQPTRRPPLSKQEGLSWLVQDMLTEGVIDVYKRQP